MIHSIFLVKKRAFEYLKQFADNAVAKRCYQTLPQGVAVEGLFSVRVKTTPHHGKRCQREYVYDNNT